MAKTKSAHATVNGLDNDIKNLNTKKDDIETGIEATEGKQRAHKRTRDFDLTATYEQLQGDLSNLKTELRVIQVDSTGSGVSSAVQEKISQWEDAIFKLKGDTRENAAKIASYNIYWDDSMLPDSTKSEMNRIRVEIIGQEKEMSKVEGVIADINNALREIEGRYNIAQYKATLAKNSEGRNAAYIQHTQAVLKNLAAVYKALLNSYKVYGMDMTITDAVLKNKGLFVYTLHFYKNQLTTPTAAASLKALIARWQSRSTGLDGFSSKINKALMINIVDPRLHMG